MFRTFPGFHAKFPGQANLPFVFRHGRVEHVGKIIDIVKLWLGVP